MNLTRHILATLAMAVAFGAAAIAGDNTIMCALRSPREASQVMEKLKKMLDTF